MHYKYRWLYAVLLSATILLLGVELLIKPPMQRYLRLQTNAKQVDQQLLLARKFQFAQKDQLSMQAKWKPQAAVLTELATNAEQTGLKILSMTMKVETLQIDVQGTFFPVINFITTLQEHGLPLLRFNITVAERGVLHVLLDVLLPQQQWVQSTIRHINIRQYHASIFCRQAAMAPMVEQDAQNDLRNTSLKQLRFVGYLHENNKSQALLQLPNTLMVAVQENDEIGKERGIVRVIKPNGVMVLMPDKKIMWVTL